MSCVDLKYISSKECMGNSLSSINGNFAALSAAVCSLSSIVPSIPDTSINVFDSPTIDLVWNASTRTLSAATTSTVATSSSPMVAKAWVNFNGTTSPGTIRSSYNVSSVTKNGTGNYTVTFATSMSDSNYVLLGTSGSTSQGVAVHINSKTLSSCNIFVKNTDSIASVLADSTIIDTVIFGN